MPDVFFIEGKGLRKMDDEHEGWVNLTDIDKYNHCKPFIDYIGRIIQKHSTTKLQDNSTPTPELSLGNTDSRDYLFYLSIGGNPETPYENGFFQLFPNLFIKDESTKVYYVGIDIFNKVTKVINYKQFEGEHINKDKKDIIEVKLFSMYWIDDCKELIDSLNSLVNFNSKNPNCLGTICVNFAKFKYIRSPVFEKLNNIFPVYDNIDSLKFLKEIKTTKSVYMHSLGYYKFEIRYMKKYRGRKWLLVGVEDPEGMEKLVLSATMDLSNQISFFDSSKLLNGMLENVGNSSYLPEKIPEEYPCIADIEIEGDKSKFPYSKIVSNNRYYGFGIEDYNEEDFFTVYGIDGENSLFNGEFIDIKEAPECIIPSGKLNDVEESAKKEGEFKTLAGGYIFDKIINPVTGRKVKTNSRLGIKILKKYIKNFKK